MFKIQKSFEFDYGHRVWTQVLDEKYALTKKCSCKHLHGHRGKIVARLCGAKLDSTGMLIDFNHLNFFKRLLDENFDHRFIIDIRDPIVEFLNLPKASIQEGLKKEDYYLLSEEDLGSLRRSCSDMSILEGLVFIRGVPTSERLAELFFFVLSRELRVFSSRVKVHSLEFWETPKSMSSYECF